MRILLTNDDGIYAPGLRARARSVQLGDVVVVAPATEQSAAGHSVTLLTPLLINEVYEEDGKTFIGWAVEGRPADCEKLCAAGTAARTARRHHQRPERRQ